MNVIFHTLASVATAAVLSAQLKKRPIHSTTGLTVLLIGFIAGVLLHGLLDWSSHQYPLPSVLDVGVSLILFSIAFMLAHREARWILFACFLGAIFPDLMDLGPAILNKQMQLHLPTVKLFPWHWKEYSGSIYDGSRRWLSILNHLLVIGISGCLILRFRAKFDTNSVLDVLAGV
ncbi:hypothetical protein JQ629_35030 [Bradyrhizobium sp. AUGA SZCCT0222]|uniref:hypothetical protein n=1 Tax=Bradyrhizobium sp. AUGA SZCCT0222 TaxID=2807668 RepID=UPI001BACCE54|nr:hypothetical protein [Bradyrhizobium sp. AUGA SZCCT0222]MBR1272706.1 hypothetical protein [Bradyrhizobium sp. AUGA SZCCT0222]